MCNDNSKISQEIPCWASNLTALFYPLNHQLLSKKTFWTCFKTFEQESFLNSKKAVWLCQQPPGLLWAACELALGRVRLCGPVDCSHQAPLSTGFSRQESWSGLPFFSRGFSRPRDWIHVSRTSGGFSNSWAIGEAHWVSSIGYVYLVPYIDKIPTSSWPPF